MSILNQLGKLSSAEDFFVALDLPYDPAVVNVARLHILRRMGQYLRGDELGLLDDTAARQSCRSHLEKACTTISCARRRSQSGCSRCTRMR